MKKEAGVIGHPIRHSLSPEIFRFLAAADGHVDLNYLAYDVEKSDLKSFLSSSLREPSFVGFNVTVPHKEGVLTYSNHLSDEVEKIGAANVLAFKDNEIFAFNTDVIGILDSLTVEGVALAGARVLILGAGGAARSALYVCGLEKARQVTVLNRNPAKAEILVAEFQKYFRETSFIVASDDSAALKSAYDLVIQATPLGMSGYQSSLTDPMLDFYGDLFAQRPNQTVAFDLVYRPAVTPFLRVATSHRQKTIGGLGMLVGQALATWEIWFEEIPHKEKNRKLLTKHLQEHLRGDV